MDAQVAAIVLQVMGIAPDKHQPLMEAGLDSLGAVELRNALGAAFGLDLPPTVTLDYPSIAALADYIASVAAAGTHEREHTLPYLSASLSVWSQAESCLDFWVEQQLICMRWHVSIESGASQGMLPLTISMKLRCTQDLTVDAVYILQDA